MNTVKMYFSFYVAVIDGFSATCLVIDNTSIHDSVYLAFLISHALQCFIAIVQHIGFNFLIVLHNNSLLILLNLFLFVLIYRGNRLAIPCTFISTNMMLQSTYLSTTTIIITLLIALQHPTEGE